MFKQKVMHSRNIADIVCQCVICLRTYVFNVIMLTVVVLVTLEDKIIQISYMAPFIIIKYIIIDSCKLEKRVNLGNISLGTVGILWL